MEQTFLAIFLAVAMTVSGLVMSNAALRSVDNVSASYREVTAITEERLSTKYTVVSTQINKNGDQITISIKNEGNIVLTDPRLTDMIITYTDNNGVWGSRWLPYADGTLTDNSWTITDIIDDRRNPGMLDPGETMTVAIKVSPPVKENEQNRWLTFVSSTGIAYTIYF